MTGLVTGTKALIQNNMWQPCMLTTSEKSLARFFFWSAQRLIVSAIGDVLERARFDVQPSYRLSAG